MKTYNRNKYDELLKEKCDRKLKEIFPAGIPEKVTERYRREFDHMLMTGSHKALALYSELSDRAAEENVPLLVRGTARCSLLTCLLGNSLINPLDAYYYCPECGHYEQIADRVYGIDAPQKNCPECGAKMSADGFSLEENFVWDRGRKTIHFEYATTADFVPVAGACIKQFFHPQEVVSLAGEEWTDNRKTGNYYRIGYAVLPEGKSAADYSEHLKTLQDGTEAIYMDFDDARERGLTRILIMGFEKAELLAECVQRRGAKLSDIRAEDLRAIGWQEMAESGAMFESEAELLYSARPQTFYGCIQAICAMHSTYGEKPGMLLASRDALYRFLKRDFAGGDVDEALLFEIADFVRRGMAANERRRDKWEAYVEKAHLTEEMAAACERSRYLWPESHALDYLMLHAMIAKA